MLSPVGNVEKDQRLPLEFSSSGKTSGGEQPSRQRRSNRGGRPTGGWRPLRAAPTGRDLGLVQSRPKLFGIQKVMGCVSGLTYMLLFPSQESNDNISSISHRGRPQACGEAMLGKTDCAGHREGVRNQAEATLAGDCPARTCRRGRETRGELPGLRESMGRVKARLARAEPRPAGPGVPGA